MLVEVSPGAEKMADTVVVVEVKVWVIVSVSVTVREVDAAEMEAAMMTAEITIETTIGYRFSVAGRSV